MSLLRLATLPPLLSPQTDGLDAGRSGRWDGFLVSDRCCAFLVATSWSEGTRRRTAQTRRFLPREFWAKLRSLLPSHNHVAWWVEHLSQLRARPCSCLVRVQTCRRRVLKHDRRSLQSRLDSHVHERSRTQRRRWRQLGAPACH